MEDGGNGLILVCFASAFFVASLVLCLRVFIFHYRAQNIETVRQHQDQDQLVFAGSRHGLTPSAVAAIPTYAFEREIKHGGEMGNGWAQCAICLSFLVEGEMVRQLPECKHLFHVECIDKWLYSHATCPLCRSLVSNLIAGSEIDLEAQTSTSDAGGRAEGAAV